MTNTTKTQTTPTPAVVETPAVETTPTPAAGLTPYAAAKTVNAVYEKNGSDKRIPTQMMYNYTTARINAKKNPFIPTMSDGKIDPAGLHEWMVKYFGKQGITVE